LPPIDSVATSIPRIAIAAAGTAAGWRRAGLLLSGDDGAGWHAIGGTRGVAVLGHILVPPRTASLHIEDRRSSVEVELAHAGMHLDDADTRARDAGANLAMLGDELVQFAHAERLDGARWRLSGLWRGRRGTGPRIGSQRAGDRFVLLDADTLSVIDVPQAKPGGEIHVLAEGAGDVGSAAKARAGIDGISSIPLAPVHLAALRLPNGGVQLRWTRRSRSDWQWRDGSDVAAEPGGERYRVTLTPNTGAAWSVETRAPEMTLEASVLATRPRIEVQQIAAAGLSHSAILSLPNLEEHA
jgi:hypothetical protein